MPFRTALSTAQQTAKRSGIYSAIRYVAVNTPVVQLQFRPSANANGQAAAQIGFSTTLQGNVNKVLVGMTVYVTPTSDYRSDLINQPENCLKTYVRKSPTSAILYIGWTAFQWTTASYVTVVSNFEPALKKTRLIGTTIYKDVDVTYREPLPRIYDWYHDVAVTSGSTINYSLAPTFQAMASGAAISSYTWATIINGTVTTGVSTSATPTFSLSLGVHWLHCTVTDDNGNTNWIAVLIAVVPDSYNSVVTELVAGTVTNNLTSGIEAEITTTVDISDIMPGSAAIIFDDIVYKGNWREQVVKAFGWLDGEVEQAIAGDTQYGLRTEYRTRLLGIRAVAQTLRIPAFPFKYNAAPATWGQVARCTVYDAIWYALSEHSTIASLAAIDFPTSYTDFQYNPGIQIPDGAILDSVDSLAFFASGGMVNHSPNGELYFRQSLLYATSGRGSAVVYATYTSEDGLAQRILHPPVNRFPLSAIRAGYATYNTTTNTPRVYNSLAPAESTPTALQETLDGIIMTKNLSDANANTEAGKLTINHFFASVEAAGVSAELIAGYSTVIPSCFQWHKFDIGVGETLDGTRLDSNTRFLCTQVSSRFDKDTWGIVNSAEFREETDGGSNYARETDFVPLGTTATYPTYPPGTYSVYLDDFDIPSDTYGDDYDGQRQGWEDPTVDPETGAENGTPLDGTEIVYVPLTGGVVQTSLVTTLSASYLLRVTGSGRIGSTNWCYSIPLDGWVQDATRLRGEYQAGVGLVGTDGIFFATAGRSVNMYKDLGVSVPYNRIEVDYSLQKNVYSPASVDAIALYNDDHAGTVITPALESADAVDGDNQTFVISSSGTLTTIYVAASSMVDSFAPYSPYGGYIKVHAVRIYGEGDSPFGEENCSGVGQGNPVRGDAVYYTEDEWETTTKFPNGSGLYLDGAAITNTADFNAGHVYELTVTGTGDVFDFSFTDGYDSNYANNQNAYLQVEIIPL